MSWKDLILHLDRQSRPCYAQRTLAVLCSTMKYQLSSPHGDSRTNTICAVSQVGERRQKLLTVVADCVLRCHGPEIDHVRIIPIHDDSRLWKIVEE